MKIGIDIDEVVVEYLNEFLKFVKVKIGRIAKLEDFDDYTFTKPLNLTLEEAKFLVKEHTAQPRALIDIDLVKGAKESIIFLSKQNDLFFITSRHLNDKLQTIDFFKVNFPGNNFNLHFSGDAWKEIGNKTKCDICKELGVDVLLEDNKNYAFECASNGIRVILFDKPWN